MKRNAYTCIGKSDAARTGCKRTEFYRMSALFVSHVSNLIKLTILVRHVELYGKFTRNCILFEHWMIYPDKIF